MSRWSLLMGLLVLCGGTAWAADGAQLYEKKCKICHSVGGVGGPKKEVGGPLDDVGSKRDEAWLRAYLKDPKSKLENSKMPKMAMPDAELDALVQYLLSLKGAK